MPPKKKLVTLTDSQKYEFCLYANHNNLTQKQYVNWMEQKWGLELMNLLLHESYKPKKNDLPLK